jgi:hypothetical protein
MNVREATMEDLDWLVEQSIAFCTEHRIPFDADYLPELTHQVLDAGTNVLLIAETHERVGMLIAVRHPHPYSPNRSCLTELAWWVVPSARNSRAGAALLATYIKLGQATADQVSLSTLVDSPINHDSLLKRGFMPREMSWILEN